MLFRSMGIKPDLNPEGGSLGFKRHKGIFYKICERAKKHLHFLQSPNELVENHALSHEITKHEVEDISTSLEKIADDNSSSEELVNVKPSFDAVFAELMKPLKDEQKVVIKMSSGASFKIYKIEDNRVYYYQQDGASRDLSLNTIRQLYESSGEYNTQGKGVYYNPLNAELHKLAKIDFKKNQNYRPSQNTVSQHNPSQNKSSQKKYVIIIDEINRANISRVFGELITLIEDDKRLGNDHAMEIRLPDGETKFTVPNNLYIIGTMNTADKSIALLDIALRRRFEFTPLYPDSKYVVKEYRVFFETLNEEIKVKKGIDFTIGHSYFFPKNHFDFVKTMNSKVIPLLNEYFYSTKDNKTVVELLRKALNLEKFSIDETGFLPKIKKL